MSYKKMLDAAKNATPDDGIFVVLVSERCGKQVAYHLFSIDGTKPFRYTEGNFVKFNHELVKTTYEQL